MVLWLAVFDEINFTAYSMLYPKVNKNDLNLSKQLSKSTFSEKSN